MISTVTTATVSTLSAVGFAASLGVIAVLTLICALAVKELATAGERPQLQRLSRVLNVAILPLLMVFGALVLARVVQAL